MTATHLKRILAAIVGVALLVAVFFTANPKRGNGSEPSVTPASSVTAQATTSTMAEVIAETPRVVAAGDADPDLGVFLTDAFNRTQVHQRWTAQGVTETDIASALETMKKKGFSGAQLRDPNLVGQFLPARNIEPVFVEEITLPVSVSPNQPVSFSVKASFPSPAYTFEKWEIRRDGTRVTVRPVGSRTPDPVAAVVVPVELEGNLPGLDPGDYVVRFEAIGEPVERVLKVQ